MEASSDTDGKNHESTEPVHDGQPTPMQSHYLGGHADNQSYSYGSLYGRPAMHQHIIGDCFQLPHYSGVASPANFQNNVHYPQITLPPRNPTFSNYVASLPVSYSPHQAFTPSNQTSFSGRAGTLPMPTPQSTPLVVASKPQLLRLPGNNQPHTNVFPRNGIQSSTQRQFPNFHNPFFSDSVIKPPSAVGEVMEPDSSTPAKEVSSHINRKKRKACGRCGPCRRKDNCGTCMNCVNRAKGKQICVFRKCEELKKKPGTEVYMSQVDRPLENLVGVQPEKRKDLELLLTNKRKRSKTEEFVSTSNRQLGLAQPTPHHFSTLASASTSQQHNFDQIPVQQHQSLPPGQAPQAYNPIITVADNSAGYLSHHQQQNPQQDISHRKPALVQTETVSSTTTDTTDIISEALREIENHSNSGTADVTTLAVGAAEGRYGIHYQHQYPPVTTPYFKPWNQQYPPVNSVSVSAHLQEHQSNLVSRPPPLLPGPGQGPLSNLKTFDRNTSQTFSEQLLWSQCNVFGSFQKNNSNSQHISVASFSNLNSQSLNYATDPGKFSNNSYNHQDIDTSCDNIQSNTSRSIIPTASTFKASETQPVSIDAISTSGQNILGSEKADAVASSSESIMYPSPNLVPYNTDYSAPHYVQMMSNSNAFSQCRVPLSTYSSLSPNAPPTYHTLSTLLPNTGYSSFNGNSRFPATVIPTYQEVGVGNSSIPGICKKNNHNLMLATEIDKLQCEVNVSTSVIARNVVTTAGSTESNQMYLQEQKETGLLKYPAIYSLCGSQVTPSNSFQGPCHNFDGTETLQNTTLYNPCDAKQLHNQEMMSSSSAQYSCSSMHSPTTLSFSNSPVEMNQQSLIISHMPKLVPSPAEVTESNAPTQDQVTECAGTENTSSKPGFFVMSNDSKKAIANLAEPSRINDDQHSKNSFLVHPGSSNEFLNANQCHFPLHGVSGMSSNSAPVITKDPHRMLSAARHFTSTESNLSDMAKTRTTSSQSIIYRPHSSTVINSQLMAACVNQSSVEPSAKSKKSPTETALTISPGESGYDSTEIPLCNDEIRTTPVQNTCEVKKEICDGKPTNRQSQVKKSEPKNLYRAPVGSKAGSLISFNKSNNSQLNLSSAGACASKHSIEGKHLYRAFISSPIKRSYSSDDWAMEKRYQKNDKKHQVPQRRYSYQEMGTLHEKHFSNYTVPMNLWSEQQKIYSKAECKTNSCPTSVSINVMDTPPMTPGSTDHRRMGFDSLVCGPAATQVNTASILPTPPHASETTHPPSTNKHLEQEWIKKTLQSEKNRAQGKSTTGVKRDSNTSEFPSCDCIVGSEVRDSDAPYYTHLGSAESVVQIRQLFEERTGYSGNAIRIERVKYTGKEGKTSRGCPIAKWIIRRTSEEEKVLIICRKRPMHHCKNSVIVLVILLWDGVTRPLADFAYTNYSTYVPKHGEPTERRCGTNDEKTCACQGFNDSTCGASFSFGCSWSMYYNGCKFARSAQPNKYKLNATKNPEAEKFVGQLCERLATVMSPLYKMAAPESFWNQVERESSGFECRLGENTEPNSRPFSGVTACLDFCAHAHKDQHNMENGSTVVLTLTKPELRTIGVKPKDEQLHVLPLYKLELTDEPGIGPSVEAKVANGSIEKLSGFRRPVRVRNEPRKTKKQKAKAKKKTAFIVDELSSPPCKRKGRPPKQIESPENLQGTKDFDANQILTYSPGSIANNYSFQTPPHVQRYISSSSISHHSGDTFTPPRWPYRRHTLPDQVPRDACTSMNEHLPSIGSFFKEENTQMLDISDNPPSAYQNSNNGKQSSSLYTPLPSLKDVVSHPFHQTFAAIGTPFVTTNSHNASSFDALPYSSEQGIPNKSPRPQSTLVSSFFSSTFPTKNCSNYPSNPNSRFNMQTPANATTLAENVYSDSEENFYDPDIGGVAIAPGHGSVLIECAKKELHATTPLLYPNRFHPSRISLVFYQHKSLNSRNHGAAEYGAKEEKRQQLREEKRQEEILKAQAENQACLLRTSNLGSYSDSNMMSCSKQDPIFMNCPLPISRIKSNQEYSIWPHNSTVKGRTPPQGILTSQSYPFDHQSTHDSCHCTNSHQLVNSVTRSSVIQSSLNSTFSAYYHHFSTAGQSAVTAPITTTPIISSSFQYDQFSSPKFLRAQLNPSALHATEDKTYTYQSQPMIHFHHSEHLYPRSHLLSLGSSSPETAQLHTLSMPCNYIPNYYNSTHQLLHNNTMRSRQSHPQQHHLQNFSPTEYNLRLPQHNPARFPYPRPGGLDFSRGNIYSNGDKH